MTFQLPEFTIPVSSVIEIKSSRVRLNINEKIIPNRKPNQTLSAADMKILTVINLNRYQ